MAGAESSKIGPATYAKNNFEVPLKWEASGNGSRNAELPMARPRVGGRGCYRLRWLIFRNFVQPRCSFIQLLSQLLQVVECFVRLDAAVPLSQGFVGD